MTITTYKSSTDKGVVHLTRFFLSKVSDAEQQRLAQAFRFMTTLHDGSTSETGCEDFTKRQK